jgi:fructokinase
MKKTVVSFGEILWDLLPSGPKLGGAPFNFAYRVHSLGDSGLIVSRLGRDELGKQARAQVTSLGMDSSHIQCDECYPTGTVRVALDEKNNPDYFIVPAVAYDNIELTEALLEVAPNADCFCFGTLVQRTPTSRRTLLGLLDGSRDAIRLLDINLRKNCYSTDTIISSLERANILKLNEQEALYLADLFEISRSSISSFCEQIIQKFSLSHCVVTLGDRGAFAASADTRGVYVPGYSVAIVDTCGSGDAFTAGFIYRLLRNQPLTNCCELGNVMGAMVAAQPGATMAIPTAEIEEFMQADHVRISDARLEPFLTKEREVSKWPA